MHNGKRIAVATRWKETPHRHIEIFDIESGEFHPVTKLLNPELHHYNPFVSPGSKFLGYHRFRGSESGDKKIVRNLEPVASSIKTLKMLRINGSFPSFSPDGELIAYNSDFEANGGGITIVKSEGSKRWTLLKGHGVAFYYSWNPSDNNVIFTSLGGIFQPVHVTVQIARVTFDASNLDDQNKVEIKVLTKQEIGNNAFPASSLDGKLIVFRSGRSGHKNLYLMDAVNGEFENSGGFILQLTEGPWIDTMPSWSPDGQLIAFSSNRHDPTNEVTFGVYVVRPDGSGLSRVHMEGSSDVAMERISHVCFSPNGEWLVFTANTGGVTAEPVSFSNQFQPYVDLFTVKLDGIGLTRLTWNGYENRTPTWHSGGKGNVVDLDLGRLSLNEEGNGDKLTGQFQEPLWITNEF